MLPSLGILGPWPSPCASSDGCGRAQAHPGSTRGYVPQASKQFIESIEGSADLLSSSRELDIPLS
jgi:hypothetical protein